MKIEKVNEEIKLTLTQNESLELVYTVLKARLGAATAYLTIIGMTSSSKEARDKIIASIAKVDSSLRSQLCKDIVKLLDFTCSIINQEGEELPDSEERIKRFA